MDRTHEGGADLTDVQENLLRSAVRKGYFRIPQEVTLVTLAEEHDMSSREVAEQIRRGLDVVVRDAVLED